MRVKFKGRVVKKDSWWEMECDLTKDNYEVSQRNISVVVNVNGVYNASLKEYFEIEMLDGIKLAPSKPQPRTVSWHSD